MIGDNTPHNFQKSLYIGSLPKQATEALLKDYFSSFDPCIEVELVFKKNRQHCRGYGTLHTYSAQTAEYILQQTHFLFDRRLVVERIKTQAEIYTKYSDLQLRKLRILFPVASLPEHIRSSQSFRQHFSTFGRIENAKFFPEPEKMKGKHYYVGNLTYMQAEATKLLEKSAEHVELGYIIEKSIPEKQTHSQIKMCLPEKGLRNYQHSDCQPKQKGLYRHSFGIKKNYKGFRKDYAISQADYPPNNMKINFEENSPTVPFLDKKNLGRQNGSSTSANNSFPTAKLQVYKAPKNSFELTGDRTNEDRKLTWGFERQSIHRKYENPITENVNDSIAQFWNRYRTGGKGLLNANHENVDNIRLNLKRGFC